MPFANLVRYRPSGTYFARLRVRGKLILKSLKTDVLSVAKLRLADRERAERPRAEAAKTAGQAAGLDRAEVLDQVAAFLTRYLALPAGAADAPALWVAHTHCFEAFEHTPRLSLFSPDKGCGKTTTLDLLACLVPRPLRLCPAHR